MDQANQQETENIEDRRGITDADSAEANRVMGYALAPTLWRRRLNRTALSLLVGEAFTSASGYSSYASTASLTYSASPPSSSESSDTPNPLNPDEPTSIARPASTVTRPTTVTFATLPRPDHTRPNHVQTMVELIESLIRSEQGPETTRMDGLPRYRRTLWTRRVMDWEGGMGADRAGTPRMLAIATDTATTAIPDASSASYTSDTSAALAASSTSLALPSSTKQQPSDIDSPTRRFFELWEIFLRMQHMIEDEQILSELRLLGVEGITLEILGSDPDCFERLILPAPAYEVSAEDELLLTEDWGLELEEYKLSWRWMAWAIMRSVVYKDEGVRRDYVVRLVREDVGRVQERVGDVYRKVFREIQDAKERIWEGVMKSGGGRRERKKKQKNKGEDNKNNAGARIRLGRKPGYIWERTRTAWEKRKRVAICGHRNSLLVKLVNTFY
ncbi:Protein of unknown function [Pyronema omphalodes CBS 100304]|uniref:Uncharacterized protein n=1 Tax=Pyronema omphalodes (strain CBS 100304) TaxID=1076935 RepID=U4L5C0_PYROM|nr:Protein of unknown function [Pyronema omphalodes CBS 100304]CCX11338.1 Protein of unknown function [Pyronema omphalodes CBS 100304]